LLGFEQRAGRTADPIGLRACFSAVDCSSTVRSWGWNRSTTSRPIKAWGASGQLVRTPGLNGRSMFTARTPDVPQVCDAVAVLVSPSAKSLVIPTVSLPVQSAVIQPSVQHAGSAKPRTHSGGNRFKRKTQS
jgi:hypothetical protein